MASVFTGYCDTDVNELLNWYWQGSNLATAYVGALTALPTDSVGDGYTEPWIIAPTISTITSVSTGGSLSSGNRYYQVTAVNGSGQTTASAEVLYTVPAGTSTNVVTVSWAAVTGATSYKVYESSTTGTEGQIASGIATTFYQDTGARHAWSLAPGLNATGYGYQRVAVTLNSTNFPNASGRSISNGTTITFPTPTAVWATLVGWGVFDGANTNANIRVVGGLLVPVTVKVGTPPNFPPGTFVSYGPTVTL